MSAHHTISAQMVKGAAALADAGEMDVRRVVLGMPTFDVDRARIIAALASVGADPLFLARLAQAAKPLRAPTARTTDNSER